MSVEDLLYDDFQNAVDDCLVRHKSILDIMSKLQESNARISRSVFKAATSCGCIEIHAEKPDLPDNVSLENLGTFFDSHVTGELCEDCQDVLHNELGNHLFYLSALANVFDVNLYDVLIRENKKLSTLGVFNLS